MKGKWCWGSIEGYSFTDMKNTWTFVIRIHQWGINLEFLFWGVDILWPHRSGEEE